MKKILIILIAVSLFSAIPATAQVDFGIKAGLNFTEKPTDIKGIKDGHTGWYAGPMVKFIFPVVGLGLEANVLYSNTGTSINEEVFNKNSIDIPVYLRYELSFPAINKFIEPFIAVGPQWAYTFGKKEFGNNLPKVEDINVLDDLTEARRYLKFNESCFSINIGLGALLFNHLQIHANYNIALGETYEYSDMKNLAGDLIKSKNNIWQLSVAYIF